MRFTPNEFYHIYNRSNETVFYTNENYQLFLSKIRKYVYPNCNILAWVLMPNHFHLLVEATEDGCFRTNEKHRPQLQYLSKSIGILLSSYAQSINAQEGRRGKLFSHDTKAKNLNKIVFNETLNKSNRLAMNRLDYLTSCFLYIHQNPVHAGLASRLEDWEFSSYREYLGLSHDRLTDQQISEEAIELDFEFFEIQSQFFVEESMLKKLF